MTYAVVKQIEGNQVHIGWRGKTLIVRARKNRRNVEIVPSSIFSKGFTVPDLPKSLIEDHVHWIDVSASHSGRLEIRPTSSMWETDSNNWFIDTVRRRANKQSLTLVDPGAAVFAKIAAIIEPFELRQHLVIYRTKNSQIGVTLPRFDMSFVTNADGLLESAE